MFATDEGLKVFLVSPARRGAGRHGSHNYVPVSLDVLHELRTRNLVKRWHDERGVLVKNVLTRAEQRELQERQKRLELGKIERQRERRENPRFTDLYYRESPEHRWKLYNDKPFTLHQQGKAWNLKNKLKSSKKTRHWQTVIISGGKTIREPEVAKALLEKYAKQQERIL